MGVHSFEKLGAKMGAHSFFWQRVRVVRHTKNMGAINSLPGGFLQYALFQWSTQGFVEQTFDAIVDGITKVTNDFPNDLAD